MDKITLPEISWNDITNTVTRAPQLLKHQFDEITGKSNNNDITTAKIKHTRELIKLYGDLHKYLNQYSKSMCDYVKHLLNVVVQFENILQVSDDVSRLVTQIETDVKSKMEIFKGKYDELFKQLEIILKKLSSFIKEREFVQLDSNFYAAEFNKLNNSTNVKKKIDVENKLNESVKKCKYLDEFIDVELPIFFNLSNSLVKSISILLFYNGLEVFKLLDGQFSILKKNYPDMISSNLYFENESRKITKIHHDIDCQIESLKIINYSSHSGNLYNIPTVPVVQKTKIGTALYNYKSQRVGDLSFQKGDKVHVIEENSSGWWKGSLDVDGVVQRGVFLFNYFTFTE